MSTKQNNEEFLHHAVFSNSSSSDHSANSKNTFNDSKKRGKKRKPSVSSSQVDSQQPISPLSSITTPTKKKRFAYNTISDEEDEKDNYYKSGSQETPFYHLSNTNTNNNNNDNNNNNNNNNNNDSHHHHHHSKQQTFNKKSTNNTSSSAKFLSTTSQPHCSSLTKTTSSSSIMSGFVKKRVASQIQKKTINIKPLSIKPSLPSNFEEETWKKLQSAIKAIFNKQQLVNISQEELYKAVQDMCIHKLAPGLFEKLKTECEKHVKNILSSLTGQTPDQAAYLSLIENSWEDYCDQMLSIRSVFLYLDRTFVIQSSGTRSLWDMGLQLFRKYVIKDSEVETRTISGILHLLERERKGDSIQRSVLQKLVRMFCSLQIYEECLEKVALQKTREFYEMEGNQQIDQLNVPEYLQHVENRLKQESERATYFFPSTTKRPLVNIAEKQLIESHVKTIISKGFDDLINHERIHDLSRLYRLLSLVNALDPLKEAFSDYIRKGGLVIVSDQEKDKTMVEEMLQLKEKMDLIHLQAFQSNENFKYAMKYAFEKAINTRKNKPAELLAKYIDLKLRDGNKILSEEALEKVMDDVLLLFRFIDGKDVFEAFYKKDLAKRLLLGRSASFDSEKVMISKLKTECGSTFTSKLEGMFKDIEVSSDIMESFKQSKQFNTLREKDLDLNVTVITTGYWPPYDQEPINLPTEIGQCLDLFKSFYLEKHNGRSLKWQHSLGQCTLKALYESGKKELQVSVYQGIVLLLFNDHDKLTFKDIVQRTGIEVKELKRTLQSLSVAKERVLLKLPKGKEIGEDDTFFHNKDFSHKLFRIRINQIQIKETEEEQETTTEKVLIERQYVIDAAVVRIMKSRKQLSHQELMRVLLPQLKFPTSGTEIKKRIESLIDRDYLDRETASEGATPTQAIYKYVA